MQRVALDSREALKEENGRASNGDQTQHMVALALSAPPSVDFCGYWQRHLLAGRERLPPRSSLPWTVPTKPRSEYHAVDDD